MPRLTPERPREVIAKLAALGFEGPFGSGKHLVMRHPTTGIKISVPVHTREIPVGTLRAIIRAAGVSVDRWLELK